MAWENKNEIVLGIVGGMGSYATLSFFERVLNAFPAEKDWEKPRILIDNYSTLPSRVRAILYNENVEALKVRLSESVSNLLQAGATDIVLACHTSHYFLPDIMNTVGSDADKIVNMISLAKEECISRKIQKVVLLASEGTVQANIYGNVFGDEIELLAPDEKKLKEIRQFIEAVKQNKVTAESLMNFKKMIENADCPVVLGCSELPVLQQKCVKSGIEIDNQMIDPLQCVIDKVVDKYNKRCLR
jgi:aspartate racemase